MAQAKRFGPRVSIPAAVGARLVIIGILSGLLSMAGCGPGAEQEGGAGVSVTSTPVTLLMNARIYTFDPGGTVVPDGAMAFSEEGEIIAIGDSGPMADTFPQARVIDAEGRSVLPGLIDSHGHLYGLALSLATADLTGTRNKDEVIDRLEKFASKLAPGEWLLGRGWDQNDWPDTAFPEHSDLDAAFPERPVWLERIDGHAAWANSAAMAAADHDLGGDWQPDGGRIVRDADGNATGIFVDGATAVIDEVAPPLPEARIEDALDEALQRLASLGITGVHDPGISRDILERYRVRLSQGRLPVRVYAMADGVGPTLDWLCENGPFRDPSGRLEMRAVKLYADGALGSRGAALLADYSDDPGNSGLLFADQQTMENAIDRAVGCGLQVGVHAIGDRANRQVLDAYARVLPRWPDNPGRNRIEHAQILATDDIPRFSRLGIVAAMQPTHATSDMYWAGERLGPDRLAGAYAWRSLLDSGAHLAFGSDFPVEEANPMLGVYAAVTRRDLEGWPEGGWLPEQRVTREEAFRAFTLDAAWAAFMESDTGSLEVGKRADFIILDRDAMTVPEEEIPAVQVLQTFVDGQRVYPKEGSG